MKFLLSRCRRSCSPWMSALLLSWWWCCFCLLSIRPFLLLPADVVVVVVSAQTSESTRPWRRTPPSRYSSGHHQRYEDYSSHFLDKDDWMNDRRSRLFEVDLKSRKPNSFSLTSRIVAFNIATYVLQTYRPDFTKWGMKLSSEIMSGRQLYRLFTPIFLHGGVFHLLTNMYSLSQIGGDVEKIFGTGRFVATYVTSGVAGNLLSAMNSPNPSLGASGAVFGTVTSYFVFLTRNEWLLGSVGENMSIAIAQTLLVNVALGMVNPVIDNWAHIGGAVGGAAMAYYFGPRLYLSESQETGGRLLIDKPMYRLPRYIESIPEQVGTKFQRMARQITRASHRFKRMDSAAPPDSRPWRENQEQRSSNYNRPSAPNRSIKPAKGVEF